MRPTYTLLLLLAALLYLLVQYAQAAPAPTPQLPPTKTKTQLVYFTSRYCTPCKQVTTHVRRLRSQGARVAILDTNDSRSTRYVRQFKVKGTPTVVILKNGRIHQRLAGAPALTYSKLRSAYSRAGGLFLKR